MKRSALAFLLGATAACSPFARAQNIEGQLVASQFGEYTVPSVGSGFAFPADSCQVSGGGKNFAAFTMGAPIKIVDINPSHTEVVNPIGVFINSCAVSLATTYSHTSFYLTSGTGGLQEAINNGPARGGGQNTIVLNAEWYSLVAPSNPATVIASVHGNTALGLVDVTTTPYTAYAWNGSQYAAVALSGNTLTLQGIPVSQTAPTSNQVLQLVGGVWTPQTVSVGGTVSTLTFPSALGSLFTCSVATPTSTPAVSCAVANAAGNTVYGNFSGSSGAPAFSNAPVFSAAGLTNFPTLNQSTTGLAAGLSAASLLPAGTTAATGTGGENDTKVATNAYALAAAATAAGATIPATTNVLKGSGSAGSSAGAVPGTDYVSPSLTSAQALAGPLSGPRLTTPQLGTRYQVDGFTPAVFSGIGVAQTAWVTATSYPVCQAVSYSGNNYLAVSAANSSVTPGSNAAVWWAVQDANTPTQTDCAFYYTLAAATAAGSSYALEFGSNSYSAPYTTAICLAEPALQTQVNLIGVGRGFNNQLTTLKATSSCNNGWVISAPDKSGSLPYNLVISGMTIDAGGTALGCLHIYGEKVGRIEHIGCTNWLSTSTSAVPIVIGDGGSPYLNGGYQFMLNDIFVSGAANAQVNRAVVSATVVSGAPSFTISNGGSYLNAPSRVYLWGYGAGANPCTTMGTISTTYSGSAGSYVLTGITPSGYSGCSGTLYAYVPDLSAAPYAMIISLMTDGSMKDLQVANAGWKYGIFWNGSSADSIEHEHVYGDSETQIIDMNGNSHLFTEVDSTPHIGIVGGTSTTWVNTTLGNGDLSNEEENPGVAAFNFPSGGGFITNSTCGNTTTQANVFNLVVGPSGPYAHGGNFGSTNVMAGSECDTLTQENSLAAGLSVPSLGNGATATTQSAGDGSNKIATDAFVLANGGAGSGTVNSGTAYSPAYYSATGASVSGVTPFSGLEYFPGSAAPQAAIPSNLLSLVGYYTGTYSGSVTYKLGDYASDGSGNNYISLAAGNVGNALSNATYWYFWGGKSSTITGGNCVTSGQYLYGITTGGVPVCAQATFAQLSGSATLAQLPAIANNTVLGNTSGSTGTPSTISTTGSGNAVLANSPTFPAAGAASTPAVAMTGAPYTGGTATTNFPLLYLNDGAAVTTLSTAGTEFGINAPSGFTGHLVNLFVNGGSTRFRVDYLGNTFLAGTATIAGALGLSSSTAPTIADGTGAGTSPGTPTVTGNNNAGMITVITGTATPASSTLATVSFNGTLGTTPQGCSLMARNAATALAAATIYTTAPSSTAFTIGVSTTALTASTTYVWSYLCL